PQLLLLLFQPRSGRGSPFLGQIGHIFGISLQAVRQISQPTGIDAVDRIVMERPIAIVVVLLGILAAEASLLGDVVPVVERVDALLGSGVRIAVVGEQFALPGVSVGGRAGGAAE